MSAINSGIPKRRVERDFRLLAIASCVIVLAGCNTVQQEVTGSVPMDYRQRKHLLQGDA
jgi:hypothetical protein